MSPKGLTSKRTDKPCTVNERETKYKKHATLRRLDTIITNLCGLPAVAAVALPPLSEEEEKKTQLDHTLRNQARVRTLLPKYSTAQKSVVVFFSQRRLKFETGHCIFNSRFSLQNTFFFDFFAFFLTNLAIIELL